MMRGLGLLLILGVACGSGDPIPKVESIPKVEDLTTEGPTVPCIGINCPTTFVPPTLPCVADYCPTEATTPQTTETPSTETPTTQTTTTEAPTTQTTQTQSTQTPTTQPSTQPPGDFRRTVVFMYLYTNPGEYLFLRGGRGVEQHSECENNPQDYTSPCAIPITVNSLGDTSHYDEYNAWRIGDDRLDWGGAQPGQGTYSGKSASGTPMAWTSKLSSNPGYQQLNIWGDHHWMVDMEMDCAQTDDGWFELKSIKLGGNVGYPESSITQPTCIGNAAATPPYTGNSHMARCGYINKFTFDQGFCEMYNF